MNRLSNVSWTRSAFALAALAVSLPSLAHDEQGGQCGLATLYGEYVFSATGFTMPAGTALPKAVTEIIRFNGDGTLSVVASSRSINGVAARGAPGGVGTYTLAPTCVGTLQFVGGPGFDVFVAPKGGNFWMIQSDQNNVLEGRVTRISP
jgi:hypothetical protein